MINNTINRTRFSSIPFRELNSAALSSCDGSDACPWLDEYVAFSRLWSPRSYDGYHTCIGLWSLSAVNARRTIIQVGGPRHTGLYVAIVGRSSITAKTTATRIGKAVLSAAGLANNLLPENCTPQKFVNMMTLRRPDGYDGMTQAQKNAINKQLRFAGQRGWIIDEFGGMISGMTRPDGVMADFRQHLRRFDGCEEIFENATMGRGLERVHKPYLTLCCTLTPADLAPYAQKGSQLWGDGYLARFFLVSPPPDFCLTGEFPRGEMIIPLNLTQPLALWHERLGFPEVDFDTQSLKSFPSQELFPSDEVWNAFYHYHNGLNQSISDYTNHDLDGNYSRFSDKTLRIATLFASLSNGHTIEANHWAKAQEITEKMRYNLHELYNQINNPEIIWENNENKVLRVISQKGMPTSREIQQHTGLSTGVVQPILDALVEKCAITVITDGKSVHYKIPDQSQE